MHLHEGCSPLVVVHLKHGQGKDFGSFGHLKHCLVSVRRSDWGRENYFSYLFVIFQSLMFVFMQCLFLNL